MLQKIWITLIALLHFCVRIIASKNNFFEWFLPLNWQMVATSTETRAAIFRKRKHAAEKGMSVSKR